MSERKPYAYVVEGTSRIVKGDDPYITLEMGTVRYLRRLDQRAVAEYEGATLTFVRVEYRATGPETIYRLTVKTNNVHYCAGIECLIMAVVAGDQAKIRQAKRIISDQPIRV